MWIDGDFGFIWSCYENRTRGTHEEALIVHSEEKNYDKKYLSKIIPLYFKGRLFKEEIQVALELRSLDCVHGLLYPCLASDDGNIKSWVLLWMLIVSGVLFVLFRFMI